ncbi:MAG: threonine synthase [Desulfurococcaceae archaeon]
MKCIRCGQVFDANPWVFTCNKCNSLLDVIIPSDAVLDWEIARRRRFGVWRYIELLPLNKDVKPITMNEGGTPLINLQRVGDSHNLYLKFEGANPTGSFKDRGMTVGVTIAKYIGVKGVLVASTGNTAASAAAYAARAGLKCVVILPRGNVAKGKMLQVILHGAEIREIDGVFDNALEEAITEVFAKGNRDLYPLNSYNPWRLEGQKTISFEIIDELGEAPDFVIVPVGNAGNISAIWKGFKELYERGLADKLPKMIGVQAEGAAPLVKTWRSSDEQLIEVDKPNTIATAIKIGRPINWLKALRAVKESNGLFVSTSDHEIAKALVELAKYEGIGVEPASAATLAGYLRLREEGVIDKKDLVVLIATGHVLKDPDVLNVINQFL